MGEWAWRDIVAAAIIIPVVTIMAVTTARGLWNTQKRIGQWIIRLFRRFYAETVREAVAPELAHMSTKVATAIDELRKSNSADHTETSARLSAVEERQTDVETELAAVEHRLASVEQRLNIRPPNARTRATDKEYPNDPVP